MTYDRFEQLPVCQAAIKQGQQVYAMTKHPPFRSERSLRDQIERAAVSISNNVAEGFERGTTQELIRFFISPEALQVKCARYFVCSKAFVNLPISNLKF